MSQALKAFESLVLDRLHRCLRENPDVFLHYNAALRALVPYCWPVNGQGHLIKPSALEQYRSSHVFPYPGCFCAATANSEYQTESALVVINDASSREYLVMCAKDKCGYIMKALFRAGQPVLHFPHRAEPRAQELPRILLPHALDMLADVASREHVATTIPTMRLGRVTVDALQSLSLIRPPSAPNEPTPGSMIYRLHSAHRPGLTFEEFRRTFVCCECGIVSTRRKHELHGCNQVGRSTDRMDLSGVSDAEVLTMLFRLDMNGCDMTLEMFEQLMAKCPCGMVMTKRRLHEHECRR